MAKNNTSLLGFLVGLNKRTNAKHLEQRLALGKCPVAFVPVLIFSALYGHFSSVATVISSQQRQESSHYSQARSKLFKTHQLLKEPSIERHTVGTQ